MKLKHLKIRNYRNYYGDTSVEFSERLTLLLGENNDGKTNFFEVLEWLFDTIGKQLQAEDVSRKRLAELQVGESDQVLVELHFEHEESSKRVWKSVEFERTEEGVRLGKQEFKAEFLDGGTWQRTDAKEMVEGSFRYFIRKFSLFKGETSLDVLHHQDFPHLVEFLSSISRYDRIVEEAPKWTKEANKVANRVQKKFTQEENTYRQLEEDRQKAEEALRAEEQQLAKLTKEIDEARQALQTLEQDQDARERIALLEPQINRKSLEIQQLQSVTSRRNKSHALLDDMWILGAFSPIFEEFRKKCDDFRREKRAQKEKFDQELRDRLANLEQTVHEHRRLVNGAEQLPWHLPNGDVMEEMLHDQVCKVCNREAPEGSEPYRFMEEKLKEYREMERTAQAETVQPAERPETCFQNEFVEELNDLKNEIGGTNAALFNNKPKEIRDQIAREVERDERLEQLRSQLDELREQQDKILSQRNISIEGVRSAIRDYGNLSQRLGSKENELKLCEDNLERLKAESEALEKKYAETPVPKGEMGRNMVIKDYFAHIETAFCWAKEQNVEKLMQKIEDLANAKLELLQGDGFRGTVRLLRKGGNWDIKLYDGKNEMASPSKSQETLKYMSVLFAISELTCERSDSRYPLIFDAPCSEFDAQRAQAFYEVIARLDKQCVITTKDFIESDGTVKRELLAPLNCKVYRVKKTEGFDPTRQETISTTITTIK